MYNRTLPPIRRLILVLALVLASLPRALPAAAQAEIPLLLGQMAQVDLAAGEAVTYRITTPQDGLYFLTVLEGGSDAFQVTMADLEGNVIAEDGLAALDQAPLDLTAGDYLLTISSDEGGATGFALMGMIGSMGRRQDDPGRMQLGGAVLLNNMRDARYGILEVPESPSPLPVFVMAAPDEGEQPVSITVEGDDDVFTSASNYQNPADMAMAVFWTDGGRFTVTVEPLAGEASVIGMVLLGPSPTEYRIGDTIDGVLPGSASRWIYTLELDAFYENVQVALTWDDAEVDLDLTVADALVDPSVDASSWAIDTPFEEVSLERMAPGRYLIIVKRASNMGVETPFTIEISGEEGVPPISLEADTYLEEEIGQDEVRYYQFEATGGHLIRVQVLSDDEEAALWFEAGLQPQAQMLVSSGGFLASPVQEAVFLAPVDGTYYMAVHNDGAPTSYRVIYMDEGPPPTLEANDVRRGEVEPKETQFFAFPVEEAGSFVTVLLVGDGAADLDLNLELMDERGNSQIYQTSSALGANEIVSQADAPAGTYTVKVMSYGEEPSRFTLISRVEDPQEVVQASLEVTNELDDPICTLYVLPTESQEEPINRLDDPLEPGASLILELPAQHYELTAYDCDDNRIDYVEDVALQGSMFWTIR